MRPKQQQHRDLSLVARLGGYPAPLMTIALANRALDERRHPTSHDDDTLELFKELLPSPTLMQLRDKRRGVAREPCAMARRSPGSARVNSTSMPLSGKHVDFIGVISMITELVGARLDDNVDAKIQGKESDPAK